MLVKLYELSCLKALTARVWLMNHACARCLMSPPRLSGQHSTEIGSHPRQRAPLCCLSGGVLGFLLPNSDRHECPCSRAVAEISFTFFLPHMVHQPLPSSHALPVLLVAAAEHPHPHQRFHYFTAWPRWDFRVWSSSLVLLNLVESSH